MTLLSLRASRPAPVEPTADPTEPAPTDRPRHVFATALTIAAVLIGMLLAAVIQSGGDWYDARMGALITFNLLNAIAGTLYYVVWRLNNSPTAGWLSVGLIGVPLAELPFLMMGSVASPARVLSGGEYQEALAVLLMTVYLHRGARGLGFGGLSPFLWAIATAVSLGLVRALGLRLDEGTLEPTSPLGLTQRVVIITLLVVSSIRIRQLDLSRRSRWTLMLALMSTGLFALADDGHDEPVPAAMVVFTLLYLLVVGAGLVDGALHTTLVELLRRQRELTRMAVRAAAAEELAARENAVLDAVRSTVVPLSQASGTLQEDASLPPRQREVLTDTMRREIERINRTLGGSGSDPRAFPLDDLIGPMVEFQQAQGHAVVWVPTGLTVVHDPDTVARALGVSMTVVAGTTPGDAVVVRADPPEGMHAPMRVLIHPRSLTDVPLTSVFLTDGLERLGIGPTPDNISLTSVERLLQTQGGGLRLLLAERGESFGLEMSLPFRTMARNRPLPH